MAYVAEGKHAFTVSITLYNHELSDMEENNFDMLVAMQMNSLQCVFINEFVMDVLVRWSIQIFVFYFVSLFP